MQKKFDIMTLRTQRLTIRPYQEGDEVLVNRAISDSFEELHQWTDWAKAPQSMEESTAYVAFSKKCWSEETPEELPLLIFDREEKQLFGAAAFNSINWDVPRFELGYWAN